MMRRTWCYEIYLAESLDDRWLSWFLDLGMLPIADPAGTGTRLRGSLPDQSALFGLLARVRDLNLTLLEVRRVEEKEYHGKNS